MNTMYMWEEKQRFKTSPATVFFFFIFQISYKQTPSIVVYLVPKQYRICCVHIGVWMYHSVYITRAYITHTYIHTHTLLHVWKHIYTYSTTHSHIMQSHTCRLNATGYFHLLHSVRAPTEIKVDARFFRIEQISLSHNLTETKPAASEIPNRKQKKVSMWFPHNRKLSTEYSTR